MSGRLGWSVMLHLIVGCVVAVLLAWGFALWWCDDYEHRPWEHQLEREPRGWRWYLDRRLGASRVKVDPYAEEIYLNPERGFVLMVCRDLPMGRPAIEEQRLPSWTITSELTHRPIAAGGQAQYWREEAFGWPLLCVRQTWFLFESTVVLQDGIPLDPSRAVVAGRSMDGRELALPWRPLWIGLIANSCIFAASFAAAKAAFCGVRGAIRRRRGRCAHCGYILRSGGRSCSECGGRPIE